MILRRQKKRPRRTDRLRCPGHLRFVRKFHCVVPGCERLPIVAAHVRLGLPAGEQGGTSMKPGDQWTFPACDGLDSHHAEQHRIGEKSFAEKYKLDLVAI